MKLIVAYVQTPPPLRKNRHTFWWVQFGMWQASGFLSRSHSIYAVQCRLFVKTYLSGVHCYADDTQVYISFSPNLTLDQLSHGKLLIGSWYRIFVCGCLMNNLKLNDDKNWISYYWHNSWKRLKSRESAWVTQTFIYPVIIPFPLQGISVHSLTLD